jgi:GT2 family glycosyltransferase
LDLSIIVVNWNTRAYLEACLASIVSTAGAIDHEVIVVDNASADGSADMVRERFGTRPEIRLIASPSNTGFARGNNLGYAAASGEYVMVLNPDTVLQPGTVARLLAHARAHPEAGIVGGRFVWPDGRLQHHYNRLARPVDLIVEHTLTGRLLDRALLGGRLHRRHRTEDLDFETVVRNIHVSATCVLLRRSVIEAVGGLFDERFPIFYNDVDLSRRVLDRGYETHVLPDAVIVHHLGRGVLQLPWWGLRRAAFVGVTRYLRKHYAPRVALPTCLFLGLSEVTDVVAVGTIKGVRAALGRRAAS